MTYNKYKKLVISKNNLIAFSKETESMFPVIVVYLAKVHNIDNITELEVENTFTQITRIFTKFNDKTKNYVFKSDNILLFLILPNMVTPLDLEFEIIFTYTNDELIKKLNIKKIIFPNNSRKGGCAK